MHGNTPDEVAKGTVALLRAFVENGGPEALTHVAMRAQAAYSPPSGGSAAPKEFRDGRVQPKAPAAGSIPGDDCPHGRTHRKGESARGPWEAMFCSAPQKADQCKALFLQKDGSWA
ncbi:hypothetical protein [Streptomyces sp. NPDC053048]|uniref:hypothetical protein n=1 Tax=Streptomyces sp. NPDC053048 TaxID=3365694 RepID=UPI0037CF0B3D